MAVSRLARSRARINHACTSQTTIRSWRALAFAGVILAGPCYVLFQDVINGAPIPTGHVLTGMALLIATAAGHQIVPTFRDRRYPLSLAFVILAAGAVIYVGLMSGARNAEYTATKAESIEGANTRRADILADRKRAQDMLDKARAAVAEECKSGPGPRCKGRQATAEVYTAAIAGHDAKLAALGAPQTANAGYKAIAEGIVLLPWFGHYTIGQVEHGLIILLPWLAVLLAELSVPAFLSLTLGHEHLRTLAVTDMTFVDTPPPPRGNRRRQVSAHEHSKQLPTNVFSIAGTRKDIVATLVAAGRPMTVGELARAMCVTPGEASRRWREAGNRVTAHRDGKFVVVGLPHWQMRAVG